MDFSKKFTISNTKKITVVLLLAIILTVNFIASNHYFRLDLTNENRYTLSGSSKEIIKNLDDLINIKVYFSKQLPPEWLPLSQGVSDILNEYEANSNNIKITYLDPTSDEQIKSEAASLGIPELQLNTVKKDQFQVQPGYLGIALFYGDKSEVMPVVQELNNIEYDLTSKIKKLTAPEVKIVGFLTGHEEHLINEIGDVTDDLRTYGELKKELEKNYQVETISFDNGFEPLKDIDTLIVGGPRKDFSELEKFYLDQYIMTGKSVIFLIDGVDITPDMESADLPDILADLLNNFGIKVNHNLVYDAQNENVAFTKGSLQFLIPYPFWVKVIKDGLNTLNPIAAKLESLILSWPSTLEITEEKEGINYEILAKTSKYYGLAAAPYNLSPQQEFLGINEEKEPMPLAVLLKGKTKSMFDGKEPPKSDMQVIYESEEEFNMLVIAESDFTNNRILGNFPANMIFTLNAIDYMTLGSDLMEIRSKTLEDKPLRNDVSETSKVIWKIFAMCTSSILVAGYGFFRFYQRKKNKKLVS